MTSQQILEADLLDILFEQRNKAYGAYQLRRRYGRQLLKAIFLALSTVFLLLFLFQSSFTRSVVVTDGGAVLLHDVKLPDPAPKKPDLPKPPEAPKTATKQQKFTDRIEIREEVNDPLPPLDALDKAIVSDVTTEGREANTLQPPPVPETKDAETTGIATEPEKPRDVVPDRQPQFPGGMAAWTLFLQKNLDAPEELRSGEKRTVVIRFHVAEDGSITNFTVVQSAGSAFDNEVIRVLKKMPKWTPALKAGQPVSVSFAQPVTFVGPED